MGESRFNIRSKTFNRQLPPIARDAFGRTLTPGDLIILQPPQGHITWRVDEIMPEINPRFPANTVRVRVSCQITQHITTGQPLPFLLVVPTTDQPEEEPVAKNEQAEDNGGPKLTLTDGE